MKFKNIFASLLIASCALSLNAQTTNSKSARSAHQRAHQEQLANIKSSKMDRSVINDLIKEDVSKRESEVVNAISKKNQNLIADLLSEANKHIGKPYRHGMKGPSAFDCSGFTSYVYKQFGYTISPASRIQYTDGVAVDRGRR